VPARRLYQSLHDVRSLDGGKRERQIGIP